MFIVEGEGIRREIPSLPDVCQFSPDMLEEEIREICSLGLRHVLLFGAPHASRKDEAGTPAFSEYGVVQQAVREIKKIAPDICVTTDVCMCGYTNHGHCGLLDEQGCVDNDLTLGHLAAIALSHAQAGADIIAPSDMMDGRVARIRDALDSGGYDHIPIMVYSAKYASSFYGPFRHAANSAPQTGDRKGYQMDFANANEALIECALDVQEGADILMVKPAMAYLDIISRVKQHCGLPLAAYSVSGEYAMLKSAIQHGILSEAAVYETIIAIKRAGADIIITYFAKDLAKMLRACDQ